MVVTSDPGFRFKEPPQNEKKSVAEVRLLAPKQHLDEGVICRFMQDCWCWGVPSEVQACIIQDETCHIKIQLWDSQLGFLVPESSKSFDGVFLQLQSTVKLCTCKVCLCFQTFSTKPMKERWQHLLKKCGRYQSVIPMPEMSFLARSL